MKHILQHSFSILTAHEKRRMAMLAIADVIISVLDIAMLALLLLVINNHVQPKTEKFPLWYLLALLALFVIKNVSAYYVSKAKFHFAYNVAARLSEQNLLQYLEGNYTDYVSKDSSVHIRKISQQPVEFAHYVLSGFQQLFSEAALVVLVIITIMLIHPILFLLVCIVLLPPLLLLSSYIRKSLSHVRSNIKSGSEKALQHLKEALSGYVESNIYDAKDFFTHRYANRQSQLNKHLASLQTVQVLPFRLMEVFAVLGLLALVAINSWWYGSVIPVIVIGAFMAAAYKIIPGLVRIMNAASQIKTYSFTAMDLAPHRTENKIATGSIENIRFCNVSFNFNDKPVLRDFNLSIQRGEFIGLSGVSGLGKTTIINLLLGFLEPASGKVVINEETDRKQFWKKISYVKQQPFLVHDSLAANITLGYNDEKRLKQVIDIANIGSLPEIIAEGGRNISGGQRQRIAFARALYKDADLLLLDELFTELDEAAEQEMLEQLKTLAQQGKMIVLITHNKKSLSFCNRIISLDAEQ